jgi:hypothetical protein
MGDTIVWAERETNDLHVQLIEKNESLLVIVEQAAGDFTLCAGKDLQLGMDMFYHPFLYRREVEVNAVQAA